MLYFCYACVLFVICICGIAHSASLNLIARPVVETQYGRVSGIIVGNHQSFYGIPFSAPPIGNLRWKPPVAHNNWAGILNSTQPKLCYQTQAYVGGIGNESECNNINIWKPYNTVSSSAGLPVMVWIHGGSFQRASPAINVYNGTKLVQTSMDNGRDVIVVSIQYRVGGLGYMAHSKLKAESGSHSSSGNYGMLDQLAGLQWVKNNIGQFGGNANQVTIFGESAGAYSVCTLLASPLAVGLFQGAIAESAYCANKFQTQEVAQKSGTWCSKVNNCNTATDELSCLRDLPTATAYLCDMETFGAAPISEGGSGQTGGYTTIPNVDGYFLIDKPLISIAKGVQVPNVPVLLGSNAAEAMAFTIAGAIPPNQFNMTESAFPGFVAASVEYAGQALQSSVVAASINSTSRSELAAMYKYDDYISLTETFKTFITTFWCIYVPGQSTTPLCGSDAITNALRRSVAVITDMWFTSTAEMLAGALSARGLKTFRYLFDQSQDGSSLQLGKLGPYHSLDVPFLFGTLKESESAVPGSVITSGEIQLIKQMQVYWLNFANYGDPNGAGATVLNPMWPLATNSGKTFMNLTSYGTGLKTGNSFHDDRVAYWKNVAAIPPPSNTPPPSDTASQGNSSGSIATIAIGITFGSLVLLGVIYYYKIDQAKKLARKAAAASSDSKREMGLAPPAPVVVNKI